MFAVKLSCIIFIVSSAFAQIPVTPETERPIIVFDTSNIARGQYNFNFRTSDNIAREESGGFDKDGNYVVTGYYEYVNELGQMYFIQYTADKDGYHPLLPVEVIPSPPPAKPPQAPILITASLLG
ncbi:unnamed protein product [Chilo suppressalis]|uniref:Uncharacterized protein n=1 Tax=Chilo suppressalis TaxID=168631 RepID=A0ABN8BCF5_CHISP|nr:hypothetical protein evm_009752 [Chilo suppressalis]CAH0407733.1 unnamed protein product [Chilo suppressalis]